MKVFNLQCPSGHGFEGWFGSEADFLSQGERGLLTCPMCGLAGVFRVPSAPRLNLSGATAPTSGTPSRPDQARAAPVPAGRPTPVPDQPAAAATPERAQAEAILLQAVRHVLANTEDVGTHFADEARRMHHGEIEPRGIRGQASAEEARSLHEDGIEVFSLPIPEVLKGPMQ